MTRLAVALVALLVVAAGCASVDVASGPSADAAEPSASDVDATASVTRVVDGDTVRVQFADGSRDTIRLLGVDTPEVFGNNSPGEYEGVPDTPAGRACLDRWGEEASAFAKATLANRTVGVAYDERGDRRDIYDRLLAYVVVDGRQFNYRLVAEGYARMYDSAFTHRDRYAAAEERAMAENRGLWACRTPGDDTGPNPTPVPDGGTTASPSSLVVGRVNADAAGDDNENLNDEYVVLENRGDDALSLAGWTVSDETAKTYTFPAGVELTPGESLTLHTGTGSDRDGHYYWGRESAVWNNAGDTVTVTDDEGVVALRHSY